MEYYDATKLDFFASCPRKYYWRYVEKIEPVDVPLWKPWGRAIHRGLETLYAPTHNIDLAVAAFDVEWAEGSQGEEDKGHTGEGGVGLLRAYHKNWFPEELEKEETELKFMATLDTEGLGIQYLGYVDLLARDSHGRLILLDHKTASKTPGGGVLRSPQLTGYVWLVEQVREESPSAYLNFLINTKVPQFMRQSLCEGGEEQWKANVGAVVKVIRGMHSLEDHYQARSSCSFYGKCEFCELCDDLTGDRLRIIDQFYRPKSSRQGPGGETADEN